MSKPNFFANLDVINCLLGMQYERTALPAMDLTMDVLELPFWFSLKNDEQSRTLKLYTQMELYTKKEEMAVSKGSVVLDDVSGNAKVSAPPGIGEHMAAFYIACRNLSIFAKENSLEKLWADADPEQTGILLTVHNGTLRWKRVSGMDRPELTVERMFGGTIQMRPYMDDFMDRSETDMMSLDEKIEKAEGGNKFAIARLATAYLNGDDEVEQDPSKAAYWYRKEAELQDSEGAFNLGLLYAKGYGVERDFTQAAEWMEKALAWGDSDAAGPAKQYREMAENQEKAEAGDAEAMAELAGGYMAIGGSLSQAGPDEDYRQSLFWAQKSADASCAAGYWPLALAYEHGRGVRQDKQKAIELYRKGAEKGNAACQHSYGCCLINGDGVRKDTKQALALFERSADQGYTLAYKALGRVYETGEGVEPDFEKEMEYYEKACQADPGDAEFLRHVGFQYTNLLEGDEKSWVHGVERSAYWLRKAADQGDRTAAGGADMWERVLELYRMGLIPLGASISDCMGYLAKDDGKMHYSNMQEIYRRQLISVLKQAAEKGLQAEEAERREEEEQHCKEELLRSEAEWQKKKPEDHEERTARESGEQVCIEEAPGRDQEKRIEQKRVFNRSYVSATSLLKRAFFFLEDGEWNRAYEYCERVLDIDPENAEAYLGELMAELMINRREDLAVCFEPFTENKNYKRALKFGDAALQDELRGYGQQVLNSKETAEKEKIYQDALSRMSSAGTEDDFKFAAEQFHAVSGYRDADEKAEESLYKAEEARKTRIYENAVSLMNHGTKADYENAIREFKKIPKWWDSEKLISICQREIETNHEEETAQLQKEKEDKERLPAIVGMVMIILIIAFLVLFAIDYFYY